LVLVFLIKPNVPRAVGPRSSYLHPQAAGPLGRRLGGEPPITAGEVHVRTATAVRGGGFFRPVGARVVSRSMTQGLRPGLSNVGPSALYARPLACDEARPESGRPVGADLLSSRGGFGLGHLTAPLTTAVVEGGVCSVPVRALGCRLLCRQTTKLLCCPGLCRTGYEQKPPYGPRP